MSDTDDSAAGAELDRFRAEVRTFIAANAPQIQQRPGVRSPETPEELAALQRWTAQLFAAGYLGANWPQAYGGDPGYDARRDVVVAQEMARVRALEPIAGNGLVAHALIHFGTETQQSHHLPRIRRAEEVWCQLFSEPGAGSDLASLRTRAVPDGDNGWRVSGQKVWTTNGQWSDYGFLLARTDPDVPKHRGISAFVLDMRAPGVTVRPLREITGTSDFNEVFLDEVPISPDAMIGGPGQGWMVANAALAHERAGVAKAVSNVEKSWYQLYDLCGRLEIDGRPAIARDDVRQQLGRFYAELTACRAHVDASMDRLLAGQDQVVDAPMGKLLFSELNYALAEYGVTVQEAAGLTAGAAAADGGWWQDSWLYARAYTIAGGSSEIMRNLIAERGLGLPREPS
ncbi:MAG TPA: acyl-CoA dehydrogenase family protein [Mycobacteriales bacterium]|nr:acyl-CoA dehydrogenase family protein [Mycobacteriales bacterium]